jgi:O-methyltransferase involved in polyketide biosynthesis
MNLTQEKETLFVPLLGKAEESRRPNPILRDPKAEEIIKTVNYDFSKLNVPIQSRTTLAMRAKKLDDVVRAYLATASAVPSAASPLVLHLGCGLDSRVLRVGNPPIPWYDLDYPAVIDLRRQFYEETATYHMLGSSVTDYAWMDAVSGSGPAMIIAEGLPMYLRPDAVHELVLRLRDRFPGSELAFDAFSLTTVRRISRHPSIKQTGAEIHWGLDDPREPETWAPGIQLLEVWPFTASPDIGKLGLGFRLMFRLMGAIPAAQKAHRIFRYRL